MESNFAHVWLLGSVIINLWCWSVVVGAYRLHIIERCPYLVADFYPECYRTFISLTSPVAASPFVGTSIPFKSGLKVPSVPFDQYHEGGFMLELKSKNGITRIKFINLDTSQR